MHSIPRHRISLIAAAITLFCGSAVAAPSGGRMVLDSNLVITASQTEKTELSAPASVTVISREQFKDQPVNDLSDILKRVPGVHINARSTYGRNEIKIRGMNAEYTLLLVNGRRVNSRDALTAAYANDFDLSSIPVAAIERIEVIRGAMSSLYGADALGGVVNVILRQPGDAFEGSASLQFDAPTEGKGGDTSKTGVYLGGPLVDGKLLGNVSLEGIRRSAWQTGESVNRNSDALEERGKVGMLGNLKWLLSDSQDIDADLSVSRDKRTADWNNNKTTPRNIQEMERVAFGLGHNARWQDFDTRVRYYLERSELRDDSELNLRVVDIEQLNQTFDAQGTAYLGRHTLTFGGEYRTTYLDNGMNLANGAVDVHQSALYAQDEIALGDLSLTLGARLDDHQHYGNKVSPRAYLNYHLTQNWVIKGGVSKAFKAPTIAQSDPDYVISSCRAKCSLAGNANLTPETATSYEIATLYQGNAWGGGVTLFNNDIEDMILADTWNNQVGARLTYRNVNEARVRGVEMSLWRDLNDSLSLSADLTVLDARDRETDKELTLTPKRTFNSRLDWHPRNDLSTFLAYQYTGRQYVRTGERSSGYDTVDLGLVYSGLRDTELSLGITNLTNSKRDDTAVSYDYIMKSRSLQAGVTYNF
ncbi:TonB-dependent receptor [Pseudomonas sp. ABC1]|uniref:TonB-dependent receptor domain-containing protein n=1 Tax=Pseudomonas sp. ABC1 TaxID=2748080 RepID=UPI0015C40287|nr:TonB-dependent receptor [Pseudomonas sp. ABC1]QLF93350.1 TonB-dependent receptor [Pseudomonas sp. ABC1]